ncbi:MAG: S9 family peptidase [Deltaproteobacteria bacterium]|nr:S9 family peptidase [Deltaproteobacteria bacterium]
MVHGRKNIQASPIMPEDVAGSLRLGDAKWDSDGETLVWLEGRSGQGVLVVKGPGKAPRDLTGELNVHAEVGYGGGDFTVHGGHVYFVLKGSGRIYRMSLEGGKPVAITPDFGRSASMTISPCGQWMLYVHHDDGEDRLAVVDTLGRHWPRILSEGWDFYMQPRWSRCGKHVAWISWNHPNMPWDGSVLQCGQVLVDGEVLPTLENAEALDGAGDVSVFQPEFSEDGTSLYYVSDREGFGQIWNVEIETGSRKQLTFGQEEYGQPAWVQDLRTYALIHNDEKALTIVNRAGFMRVCLIDLKNGAQEDLDSLSHFGDLSHLSISPNGLRVSAIASGGALASRLIGWKCPSGELETYLVAAQAPEAKALSKAEPMTYESAGGCLAHGIYYPPVGSVPGLEGPPPLLVIVHGGPTSQETARYNVQAQYFATRGYAVFLPNHRGSSGYGRAYMDALQGQWGVVDVEDVVAGVRFLTEAGKVDGSRCAVMGGSAGGYTVLQSMIHEPDVFCAGVSLYGVTDLFGLLADTHKFEAHYPDGLIGVLPEAQEIFKARSPIFHAERIQRPLAIFQGEEDRVVPLAQAESIVQALRKNGVQYQYRVYAGEGHGFRKSETITDFYESVENFLSKYVLRVMNT